MEQRTPFNDPELRDWMTAACGLPAGFPDEVGTLGFGPFKEYDFDGFLTDLGIDVYEPGPEVEVVVVGRHGWNTSQLEKMISDRHGSTLRIYSQEMALAFIFAGSNPFDSDEEVLLKLAEGHPALEHLAELGFDWPSTEIVGGGDGLEDNAWPSKGLLSHMGYHVGVTAGLTSYTRQKILGRVFEEANLPHVNDSAYMRQWGGARSKERLMKLANTLASLCRTEKGRKRPPWEAIQQRESDLAWLKSTFYDGRFNFTWPSTQP